MIHKLRRGFTMLELILVIVILGIVSSIGAEIIANVYEGYIVQRAQHRASIKTELAATQIANRLAYAIPGTVVRKSNFNADSGTDITILPPAGSNPNILQWVGADMDSFTVGGWSGFCDVDISNTTSIATPGSNLGLTNTIRTNLGLTSTSPQIYFPARSGLLSAPADITSPNPTITLSPATAKIVEHYKLATSSYALEARANDELWLYYNFSPIIDAAINANSVLLLRNVTTFRFRGDGRTIRFKICVRESIGEGNITICKEKAVF